MRFHFITVDLLGDQRQLSYIHPELEAGLDLLNDLVANGYVLLEAVVFDRDQRLSLPIEAFDGHSSCFSAIKALQQQWQRILSPPVPLSSDYTQWIRKQTASRIRQQQVFINRLERAVTRLQQRELGRSRTLCQLRLTHNRFKPPWR